jgi:hypothetical protein
VLLTTSNPQTVRDADLLNRLGIVSGLDHAPAADAHDGCGCGCSCASESAGASAA